ncbi:BTAD domain-containing putative transcriptional regulator [Nocardia vinacea]|uniref:BTAD domain-containing putative transcriptional regulator n=1 Tax=Nocardia vinacea TaxID=96468 RepID=UPI0006884A78|nr:BTAD domain-containing putative transcriptional regulator [Nocardia vinacea]
MIDVSLTVTGQFADSIRHFRRRAGLDQRGAAELAGLSVGGLRDIEQGRVLRPRAATLRKLAEVFGLSRYEFDDLVRLANSEYRQAGLRVEILGSLRVSVDGAVIDPGSQAQHALLGLLALTPNASVTRAALLDALWEVRPEYDNPNLLQSRVSRLRRRLQPSVTEEHRVQPIPVTRSGYQLTVTEYQHDLLVFRRLVTRARQARNDNDLGTARTLFAEAIGLWRGDPLDGIVALQTHPIVLELIREYRTVVVEYACAASDSGRHEEVLPLLHKVAAADPLHEAVHAALMIALAGTGQQAAAFNVFDTLRRRLASELGADPRSELTAAYQRVLRQEVRRRELEPLGARHYLPQNIGDFVGRKAELRELLEGSRAHSIDTSVAVFVLEGMAGVGKTRLAVHAAHQLHRAGRYGDCQLYVDLQGYSAQPPANPSSVLTTFLRQLGVPSEQIPPGLAERAAMYRDRLYGKSALIVLDNAALADQVLPLLPASPTSLVLITSRRTLALDGARTLHVPTFTPVEAREMLQRAVDAKQLQADPDATRRLVERCGCHPLALAVAARRLRSRPTWTIADLVEHFEGSGYPVDELGAGSEQLRSSFELSYRSLGADEQRMFRFLGLLPCDGFTTEDVAVMMRLTTSHTRHLLDRLADEHLVTVGTRDHYLLHGLLRDYACTLLRDKQPSSEAAS